jgi:hypothetical protein
MEAVISRAGVSFRVDLTAGVDLSIPVNPLVTKSDAYTHPPATASATSAGGVPTPPYSVVPRPTVELSAFGISAATCHPLVVRASARAKPGTEGRSVETVRRAEFLCAVGWWLGWCSSRRQFCELLGAEAVCSRQRHTHRMCGPHHCTHILLPPVFCVFVLLPDMPLCCRSACSVKR